MDIHSLPGGVLPIMAYTGRFRPKGVGISRAEVYERVGKSVIQVSKRAFNFRVDNNIVFLVNVSSGNTVLP